MRSATRGIANVPCRNTGAATALPCPVVFRGVPVASFFAPFFAENEQRADRPAGPRLFGVEANEVRQDGDAPTKASARGGPETWMISTAAVLVAAIPIEHAHGGELMDCEPQRVRGDGRHWAYRIIDGRQCWYPGQHGEPKDDSVGVKRPLQPKSPRVGTA